MNSRRGIFDTELTDEQHKDSARGWFGKMRKTSQAIGARFSVIPSSWFWRHRIRAIQLITNMQLAMSVELGRGDNPIGPTMAEWRRGTNNRRIIITTIVNLITTSRLPITRAMCEAHCDLHEISVRADTIRETLKDGIGLGLLEQIGSGPKASYRPTKLLIEEQALRTHARLMSDQWQEAARFGIAYKTMIDEGHLTHADEQTGKVVSTDHQSYLERLFWGDEGRGDHE